MSNISIINAYEGNLQNISLEIPRNKLTVFTGLSGSGKSTLLTDVLYMECQRQYLEAMSYQGIAKPKVERIRNVSPAIVISQTDTNKNPRSTVGTLTDIYTDLRMIYEKLGTRTCPHCQKFISAADCKEETEKIQDEFHVSMYCSECGYKMKKLTRTDFSFNTEEGACPTCEGLGKVLTVCKEKVVDETRSLEDGAVDFWEQKYKDYQISTLYAAYHHYGIPIPQNITVNQYSTAQKSILYDGVSSDFIQQQFPDHPLPKTVAGGRFEGIIPTLKRRLANHNGELKPNENYFIFTDCPDCHGERLCEQSRIVTVNQMRLPQLSNFSFVKLLNWIQELEQSLEKKQNDFVKDYLLDIQTKLKRFLRVGLGYLSLNRQTITLSGGELQRLRLAAVLDSDLTGLIYLLDEPTIGLHPKDTKGLIAILQRLRDLGNTILVIEHDPDVMNAADYIVDIGPGSGKYGGTIIGTGSLNEIKRQSSSVTGQYLNRIHPEKTIFRKPSETSISIRNGTKFNLKQVNITIPTGCLTTITGPSGSGKSTLIFEILAHGNQNGKENIVQGCEQFHRIVQVEQAPLHRSKRSNIATYSEIYSDIRTLFAKTAAAKKKGLTAKAFSFNTAGGRCENCEGMGVVTNNLLFFQNNEITCPVCQGKRFQDIVLSIQFEGYSIRDILKLSVEEAALVFQNYPKINKTLTLLKDVGLGYLELGQSLNTLSGGESQRLKLAKELLGSTNHPTLYLLDEPTSGLHPIDVENFLILLNKIVDSGNTVVIVEHNQQMIQNSDWIIDLGPDGGEMGGEIIFTGTPKQLLLAENSITSKCLRDHLII